VLTPSFLIPPHVDQLGSLSKVCPPCPLTVLEGREFTQVLLQCKCFVQPDIVHLQSLNPHLVHQQHGRVMAFSKLWVTTVLLAPYFAPGWCFVIAMDRQSGGLDDVADRIDKYFCLVGQRGYLLSAKKFLCEQGMTSTGAHLVTYTAPPALIAWWPLPKIVIRL
jgi:hypothetical protein